MGRIILAMAAFAMLSACGGTKQLHDFRGNGGGPDEFSVQPTGALEVPVDLNALPETTPGGTNITDATPNADAIAALGGRASAQQAGGIPAGDVALVTTASRYGVTPNIRAQLAEEDATFRRRKSRGGIFGGGGYFRAYASMALDAYAEFQRLRALGVQVPSAPPG